MYVICQLFITIFFVVVIIIIIIIISPETKQRKTWFFALHLSLFLVVCVISFRWRLILIHMGILSSCFNPHIIYFGQFFFVTDDFFFVFFKKKKKKTYFLRVFKVPIYSSEATMCLTCASRRVRDDDRWIGRKLVREEQSGMMPLTLSRAWGAAKTCCSSSAPKRTCTKCWWSTHPKAKHQLALEIHPQLSRGYAPDQALSTSYACMVAILHGLSSAICPLYLCTDKAIFRALSIYVPSYPCYISHVVHKNHCYFPCHSISSISSLFVFEGFFMKLTLGIDHHQILLLQWIVLPKQPRAQVNSFYYSTIAEVVTWLEFLENRSKPFTVNFLRICTYSITTYFTCIHQDQSIVTT
ncbi:hypothetical protein VP01_2823g2 [Puccinia sorghi]|uniref:Uncharacterized protein n=1 Tax=Puccinia sorghi TaxID=27349 RepID=A0A0L6V2B6_9BASI|nr:hypothetical protein VP01_2823g2 [Puccinia sorghi]